MGSTPTSKVHWIQGNGWELLIHQTQPLVEQFQRRSQTLWVPNIYRAGDTLKLPSIDGSIALDALYENIEQLS